MNRLLIALVFVLATSFCAVLAQDGDSIALKALFGRVIQLESIANVDAFEIVALKARVDTLEQKAGGAR